MLLGLLLLRFVFWGVCILVSVPIFLFMCALHNNQTYEFLYPAGEIASIEIIRVEEDIGLYYVPLESISGLLDEQATEILSLESRQFDACAEDLAELSASEWWNDPNPYIRGSTLLITYRDGSREWICADGTFYCDLSSGESSMTWYYFREEEFETFLKKYGYQEP